MNQLVNQNGFLILIEKKMFFSIGSNLQIFFVLRKQTFQKNSSKLDIDSDQKFSSFLSTF